MLREKEYATKITWVYKGDYYKHLAAKVKIMYDGPIITIER